MAKKKKSSKTILNSYSIYKKSVDPEDQVDKEVYMALCNAFNQFLTMKVMEGHKIALPARLGSLEIMGFKEKVKFVDKGIKGLSPNWKDTKELWEKDPVAKENKKLVYNLNEHSSGIRYKFLWSKQSCHTLNKTLYMLRITRQLKRALSRKIFLGEEFNSR